MAVTIADLVVNLRAQTTQFQAQMASAQAQMKGVDAGASKMSATLKTAAKVGFAAAGVAAIKFAVDSAKAASDQEEALNKVSVVFDGVSKDVTAFAETSAHAAGISKTAALDAAAGFGQMLQTAGLAADASASMSVELVKLAADLASFNNIDPTEALEKLRSGLAGEAEPLRVLGVFLSEARVTSEAYASGIAQVGSELTEAQKVQARYNLILQDTAKAQGDFVRTSDSLANQQRVAAARFADLQAEIGRNLLPVINEALPLFVDLAEDVLPLMARGLTAVVEASRPFVDFLRVSADLLEGKVLPSTENWTDRLKIGGDILGFLSPALKETSNGIDDFRRAQEAAAKQGSVFDSAMGGLNGSVAAVADGASSAAGRIEQLAESHDLAAKAAREQKAAEDALAGGFLGLVSAVDGVNEAQREINKLQRQGKTETKAYRDAQVDLLEAQLGLRSSAKELAVEMRENGASARDVKQVIRNLGIEAGLTKKEATKLANELQHVTNKANGVPNIVKTTVKADTSQAREALNNLLSLLRQVSGGAAIAVRAGINAPGLHDGGVVTQTGLAKVHRGEVFSGVNRDFGPYRTQRSGDRVEIRVDRRHFADQLGHDFRYRGW